MTSLVAILPLVGMCWLKPTCVSMWEEFLVEERLISALIPFDFSITLS